MKMNLQKVISNFFVKILLAYLMRQSLSSSKQAGVGQLPNGFVVLVLYAGAHVLPQPQQGAAQLDRG